MRLIPFAAPLAAVLCVLLPGTAVAAAEPVDVTVVHECRTSPAEPGELDPGPTAVCRVQADGSGFRLLAEDPGVALVDPSWSPDGRRVAYASEREGVVVTAADGSGRRVVTPGSFDGVVWSPDGTRLAFTGRSEPGLWVADLVAGAVRQVLAAAASLPAWAPDGSALVVTVSVPPPTQSAEDHPTDHLHVVPVGGGPARDLGEARGPSPWSPDGRHVAVAGSSLRVLATDGSGSRFLRVNPGHPERDTEGLTTWSEPVWSPDGTRIAFAYDTFVPATQEGHHGLGTVGADGSGPVVVTRRTGSARDRSPVWRPDATELVFARFVVDPDSSVREVHSDLHAIRPDGTGLRRLTTSAEGDDPDLPRLVTRPAGATRVGTAVSVSRLTRERAATVVLARSDAFPDALTAAPLAGLHDAPLLLSPAAAAPRDVLDEVRRLGATTAYLVGDTTALSARVEADLRSAGIVQLHRLGGATRYDTAAAVARAVGGRQAYVAAGHVFADAASVSALAAHQRRPVLLTEQDRVPAVTAAVLDELDATAVTVVGGAAAVSQATAAELGRGRTLDRLAGPDRWATSAAVAERSVAAGLGAGAPWLATGRDFPDALAAGPGAAATGGVLLLVDPVSLDRSPAARDWLAGRPRPVPDVVAVGGPDVVSPAVVTAAVRAAP